MRDVTEPDALASVIAELPRPLGLVPTMGALHDGHFALVDRARSECASVVVSIFVNPLQFGPGEDLGSYPRDLDVDLGLLEKRGVDLVFTPGEDFAPAQATIHVAGVSERLEGRSRPGHFDGVATIVHELLTAVGPERAYFGEKDFQQLAVIRAMVRQEGLEVEVVAVPLVRDGDGLALSSRNAYLSAGERTQALQISAALLAVQQSWDGDADTARVRLRRRLEDARGVRLDYAEIVDPETFAALEGVTSGPARALVAAWVGTTRLIDNVPLKSARP